jgi:hypothetical protein
MAEMVGTGAASTGMAMADVVAFCCCCHLLLSLLDGCRRPVSAVVLSSHLCHGLMKKNVELPGKLCSMQVQLWSLFAAVDGCRHPALLWAIDALMKNNCRFHTRAFCL